MHKRIVTYWESPDNLIVPKHILICLALLKIKMGDDFLLLTKKNISDYIDDSKLKKHWSFGTQEKSQDMNQVMSIVAKSDFIRFEYIYNHGGVWVDSDSLCVGNPHNLFSLLDENQMIWGYEAFFGAKAGYEPFGIACENILKMDCQIWGNPGLVKDLLKKPNYKNTYLPIPWFFIEPKKDYMFSWENAGVIFNSAIEPIDFLNDQQVFLHLYNKASGLEIKNKINFNKTEGCSLLESIINDIVPRDELIDEMKNVRSYIED